MNRKKLKLAIPILRSRVAPVFNWCSRVLIYSEQDALDVGSSPVQIDLGSVNAFSRLKTLREMGVRTVICGALSPDLMAYGNQLGLHIIAGVAGEIKDVLEAYGRKELDQPHFWMPGCQGRRHRSRGMGKGRMPPVDKDRVKEAEEDPEACPNPDITPGAPSGLS
jgi:predicted Fe-Mo cluster-binding NifX family protein